MHALSDRALDIIIDPTAGVVAPAFSLEGVRAPSTAKGYAEAFSMDLFVRALDSKHNDQEYHGTEKD